jgi:hypothetical protein
MLWTEDGRHVLQPPQEIREIAAEPVTVDPERRES